MKQKLRELYFPLSIMGILFILLVFLIPDKSHGSDISYWQSWAKYSFTNGLGEIYQSWTDYLPLYQYVLYIYGVVMGSTEAIDNGILYLKIITLFFEFVSTFVLWRLIYKKSNDIYKSMVYSLCYILNLAMLYNSLIWGQIDGILSCFLFISFLFAYQQKYFPALLFFLLAINLKLQAIVFLPIIAILLYPQLKQLNFRKIFYFGIALIGIQTLILLPFIISGDLYRVWMVVFGSVGKYPFISMNAYNLWYLIFDGNLTILPNTTVYGPFSLKTWGTLGFLLASLGAFYPFLKNFILSIWKKGEKIQLDKYLILAAIIPIIFFFFNTEMHERYTHISFIFLACYTCLYRRPWAYIIFSIAYFLNMEDVLQTYAIAHHTFIFQTECIASLYLLVMIFLFYDLYKKKQNYLQMKRS